MPGPLYLNRIEARRQFLRTGFVYTLREERGTGRTHARQGSRHQSTSLGPVTVKLVEAKPSDESLAWFVRQSGFNSVADWREAAGAAQDHLYLVERVNP